MALLQEERALGVGGAGGAGRANAAPAGSPFVATVLAPLVGGRCELSRRNGHSSYHLTCRTLTSKTEWALQPLR